MIRLRETLERGYRHRWLGPLVILLLVVLIAFVALHEGGETLFASAGELCVALALVLVGLVRAPARIVGRRSPASRHRGPPLVPAARGAAGLNLSISLAPLRL